jgi:hypothetical protein
MRKNEVKLYKEQWHTTADIQRHLKLGKYTLYRYINGERDILYMPIYYLIQIAQYEDIEPMVLLSKITKYQMEIKK